MLQWSWSTVCKRCCNQRRLSTQYTKTNLYRLDKVFIYIFGNENCFHWDEYSACVFIPLLILFVIRFWKVWCIGKGVFYYQRTWNNSKTWNSAFLQKNWHGCEDYSREMRARERFYVSFPLFNSLIDRGIIGVYSEKTCLFGLIKKWSIWGMHRVFSSR